MKFSTLFLLPLLLACNSQEQTSTEVTDSSKVSTGNIPEGEPSKDTAVAEPLARDTATTKTYQNKRFKDVTVERIGDSSFRISGKGQIFEANFGWVVEDGHEELKSGYQMTDAGAPEWGNFSFTVTAAKRRPNSTLHLVLYESSAMDGSRVYELPVLLY